LSGVRAGVHDLVTLEHLITIHTMDAEVVVRARYATLGVVLRPFDVFGRCVRGHRDLLLF
jgi:hypothetical protein